MEPGNETLWKCSRAVIVLLALGAIIIAALLGRICGDGVQECADGILFPHEWLNAMGRMTWGDHGHFEPTEAQFGVFWKYLRRPNVTDVDYNGNDYGLRT